MIAQPVIKTGADGQSHCRCASALFSRRQLVLLRPMAAEREMAEQDCRVCGVKVFMQCLFDVWDRGGGGGGGGGLGGVGGVVL